MFHNGNLTQISHFKNVKYLSQVYLRQEHIELHTLGCVDMEVAVVPLVHFSCRCVVWLLFIFPGWLPWWCFHLFWMLWMWVWALDLLHQQPIVGSLHTKQYTLLLKFWWHCVNISWCVLTTLFTFRSAADWVSFVETPLKCAACPN